jgi:hypothetical protein
MLPPVRTVSVVWSGRFAGEWQRAAVAVNATSAAFGDLVKLSGITRKSRFGCRLKFRLSSNRRRAIVDHQLQWRRGHRLRERQREPHAHANRLGRRAAVPRRRHARHAGRLSGRGRQAEAGHLRIRLNRRLRPRSGLAQIVELNPGINPYPTGLFWTMQIPDSSVRVNPGAGSAVYQVANAQVLDFGDFNTALSGAPGSPATVSFDVRWSGVNQRVNIKDPVAGFGGEFVRGARANVMVCRYWRLRVPVGSVRDVFERFRVARHRAQRPVLSARVDGVTCSSSLVDHHPCLTAGAWGNPKGARRAPTLVSL